MHQPQATDDYKYFNFLHEQWNCLKKEFSKGWKRFRVELYNRNVKHNLYTEYGNTNTFISSCSSVRERKTHPTFKTVKKKISS